MAERRRSLPSFEEHSGKPKAYRYVLRQSRNAPCAAAKAATFGQLASEIISNLRDEIFPTAPLAQHTAESLWLSGRGSFSFPRLRLGTGGGGAPLKFGREPNGKPEAYHHVPRQSRDDLRGFPGKFSFCSQAEFPFCIDLIFVVY